jgi:hypothetical protein
MLNLDKVNPPQFDINDIDAEKLMKLIGEYQGPIIKIVLILGSLVMAGKMFGDYHTKSQELSTEMTAAQQKLDAIKSRETAEAGIKDFKSLIPNDLTESQMITQISDFGKAYDVTITGISPIGSKDMGVYDLLTVSFNATSDNFKNILLMLKSIEESKNYLRIDSWSGQGDDKGNISFKIDVNAVLFHT